MNGAHALIHTLVGSGIDTCFANPGTSEMHLVAATDDEPGMRTILGLFEGVVSGAADGYARMTGRPAATLLHLGPGLANGLANLHNARRAGVPMVCVVGDHATYHKRYDSPLESDIEAVAGTVSLWARRASSAAEVADAGADAVAAALGPPPGIATLILPADSAWSEGARPADRRQPEHHAPVDDVEIERIAMALESGDGCLMLLGGRATRADGLRSASRIKAATGCELLTETSAARLERGAGLPSLGRLAYRAETATAQLASAKHVILVDARPPVSFFAYPGLPSELTPSGSSIHQLGGPEHDVVGALGELADRVAPRHGPSAAPEHRPSAPTGDLTARSAADAIGLLLPDGAIVVDEANTSGAFLEAATVGAPPHDWLRLTGGSIGIGLPLAVGAAVGAPGRKVVALEADGSAMYTIQALWTMSREDLDVTTVLFNNGSYELLRAELDRVGASVGPKALSMIDLSRPTLDFVQLAEGLGVEAERSTTADEFAGALQRALAGTGPRVVEVML